MPCSNQAEFAIQLQVLRLFKLQPKAKSKEQLLTINFHKLMVEPCNVLGSNAKEKNVELIAAIGVLLQVDTDKLNIVLLQILSNRHSFLPLVLKKTDGGMLLALKRSWSILYPQSRERLQHSG